MEVEAVNAAGEVMGSVMEAREAVLRARCEARAMAVRLDGERGRKEGRA